MPPRLSQSRSDLPRTNYIVLEFVRGRSLRDWLNLRHRNAPAVEPVAQRSAAHEFQDDVVRPLDLLHVVDLDQVRVAGSGHDLGFLEEALERDRVGRG